MNRLSSRLLSFPFLLSLGFLSACSAKVYVLDRHTILEDEAQGDWPQFEKQLIEASKEKGPVALGKVEMSEKKQRLYHILNGEMVRANNRETEQTSPSSKSEGTH